MSYLFRNHFGINQTAIAVKNDKQYKQAERHEHNRAIFYETVVYVLRHPIECQWDVCELETYGEYLRCIVFSLVMYRRDRRL